MYRLKVEFILPILYVKEVPHLIHHHYQMGACKVISYKILVVASDCPDCFIVLAHGG